MGQNESLPNIKGGISTLNNVQYDFFFSPYGVFEIKEKGEQGVTEYRPSSTRPRQEIILNASKTSSGNGNAYKDGAKVTTKNFSIKKWIRKF